jgi:hypothetical protein
VRQELSSVDPTRADKHRFLRVHSNSLHLKVHVATWHSYLGDHQEVDRCLGVDVTEGKGLVILHSKGTNK